MSTHESKPGADDKIKGAVHKITGEAKETLGKLAQIDSLEHEGKAEVAKGKLEETMGEVKDFAGTMGAAISEGAHIVVDKVKEVVHHKDKK